jgi:CMP-N-acetylneuraminic acid synthetase
VNLCMLIAVRGGSKRVPRKNIKAFCDTTLLEIKIKQGLRIEEICDVVVSSDDEEILSEAKKLGAVAIKRDKYYASDNVPMKEVYKHLAENLDYDHILWAPVTSPFVSDDSIIKCIELYKEKNDYDSLITTKILKEYMWLEGRALNYDPKNHPRSQDLPEINCLNFAVHILPRKLMIKNKGIIGNKFYSYPLSDYESIDIDTEFDFLLAESIYKKNLTQKK